MPVKRVYRAQGATRTVPHPYRLRSLKSSTLENVARAQPAEKLKHQKASREQALQVLDRRELRTLPVEQLRRLAAIKKIPGRRKQSIMLSLKRIYGDGVPLYPSEGRVEMREYSREEYQIGEKRVIKVDTYQEIVVKQEDLEDNRILKDIPCLRRSSRLKERVPPLAGRSPLEPPSKPRSKQG